MRKEGKSCLYSQEFKCLVIIFPGGDSRPPESWAHPVTVSIFSSLLRLPPGFPRFTKEHGNNDQKRNYLKMTCVAASSEKMPVSAAVLWSALCLLQSDNSPNSKQETHQKQASSVHLPSALWSWPKAGLFRGTTHLPWCKFRKIIKSWNPLFLPKLCLPWFLFIFWNFPKCSDIF